LTNFVEKRVQLIAQNESDQRYSDPDLILQKHNGEIGQAAFNKVHDVLKEAVEDSDHIQRWFAQLVTQTSITDDIPANEIQISSEELANRISNGDVLIRSEYSRFAFINRHEHGCYLFVDGEESRFDKVLLPAIALLCDQSRYDTSQLLNHLQDPVFAELVVQLISTDKLYFENDE